MRFPVYVLHWYQGLMFVFLRRQLQGIGRPPEERGSSVAHEPSL